MMNQRINRILLFFIAFSLHLGAFAQRLAYESKIEVLLEDGVSVTLFKHIESDNYFYLPPDEVVRLALKEDGVTPEMMFTKYTSDNPNDEQGAILHALFQWKFKPAQYADLKLKVLDKTGGIGQVAGPVDLTEFGNNSFRIVSATLQDNGTKHKIVSSGMAPLSPGGKAAIATKLDKINAQLLDVSLKKNRSISEISIVFDYEYTVLVKAAKGLLKYELDISHEQGDGIAYDMIKKELDAQPEAYDRAIAYYEENKDKLTNECGTGNGMMNVVIGLQALDLAAGNTSGSGATGSAWEYGLSEEFMRRVYDVFEEEHMIVMEWEEQIDDDRLATIRDAFFDFFLNAFSETDMPELNSVLELESGVGIDDESIKNSVQGGYHFKSCTQLSSSRTLTKTMRLDKLILPVKKRHQMVSNLSSAYRANPKCVTEVKLDNKMYNTRNLHFILDVESSEIFDKEINFVTITAKRGGSDKRATLGPVEMKAKGRIKTLHFSDIETKVPECWIQWSLRVGKVYPQKTKKVKATWEGVTLIAPLRPMTIEFEADAEDFKKYDITRATLQIKHSKFGRDTITNIPIQKINESPLVYQKIMVDRSDVEYEYRIVYNHKKLRKLATDWQVSLSDDYVYATVPDGLKNKQKELIEKLKKAAMIGLEATTKEENASEWDVFKRS